MFGEKTMETGNPTGTTELALGTAVPGWKSWRSQKADGAAVFYHAETEDGTIWEEGYGSLKYASPDKIESRTLIASSTGALVNFNGVKVYVYSVPLATPMNHSLAPLYDTRPGWLQRGMYWLDYAIGISTAWVKKQATSTLAAGDIEEGRFDIAKAIYTPSQRRPWTATGTAGKTIDANDVGGVFTFDNSAAARTMTLPKNDVAGIGHGFTVGGLGLTGFGGYGIVITPNAADSIDGGTAGASRTVPGGIRFDVIWDGTTWRIVYLNVTPYRASGRRQTVQGGPVDGTTGLPTLFPSTSASLSLTSQNVAVATPLVVSAARGFANTGAIDFLGIATANLTWSGLTASRAAATPNYLYVTVSADGVPTTGSTIVGPVYQWGGAPSTTAGAITFNIGEMKAYLGNGTAAVATALVLVGEAATDGTGVISTVAYAYNGQYDSGWTATLPSAGATVSKNANIGLSGDHVSGEFAMECTVADVGFSVGDGTEDANFATTASIFGKLPVRKTRNTVAITVGNNGLFLAHPSTGAVANLTPSSWKYKLTARRKW